MVTSSRRRALLAASLIVSAGLLSSVTSPALAQSATEPPLRSTCLATVENLRDGGLPVQYASLAQPASAKYDVRISFQGHSTYLIESPEGVKIATDFAGWLTDPVVPDAVTMNRAHSSHYTDFPDPKIKHVFHGWGDGTDIARHNQMIGDTLIRNVTTDILRWSNQKDGNSIFIFETGGLCIGHLGHLHHKLSEDHYAKIGRLDVVMVPVDGGLTMSHVSAKDIIARLRSSVILPMHVRSFGAMPQFLAYLDNAYPIERLATNSITVSLLNLPKQPTVYILAGVDSYSGSFD
ncbi:MAG: MBL fold metallo-hydrolase [Pseudomonadota bacterium]